MHLFVNIKASAKNFVVKFGENPISISILLGKLFISLGKSLKIT